MDALLFTFFGLPLAIAAVCLAVKWWFGEGAGE